MLFTLTSFTAALLALSLITADEEANVFDETHGSTTIPKNYQRHRALPFTSPSIIADIGESFRLLLQQTEYSNAFTVSPQFISPGQQFDIIIDDTHVLNDAKSIKLQVEAESTTSSRRGFFTLDINVINFLDTQLFEADAYTFEMPTRFRTAKIGMLKLIDGITAESIKYTLYGSMANYFSLEPKKDNSIDLVSLECPSECHKIPRQFALMVRAVTENSRRAYDVPISIKLSGDGQRPRFKQPVIPLSIKEKCLMDNPLVLEIVNPGNADLIFVLNDYERVFEVDEKYGILSVRDNELLTVDNLGERFNMTISVSDGKNEADTAIIIVTLDPIIGHQTMAPKFSHNVYAFAANPGESFVGQVSAQNLDGDVTYRISEGGAALFRINATDGRIFYDGPLDRDPRNYELKVLVIDESSPPQVDVALVQVLIAGLGSSPPKFKTKEPILVIINKTSGAGTVLHQFNALDADPNAKMVYSMNSLRAYDDLGNVIPDPSQLFEHFRFRKNGLNDGTLQLAKSFKNTTVMALCANITVADTSHPDEPADKVELLVLLVVPEEQISDADLVKFDQFRSVVEIPEAAALGTYIYTVNVKPLPADLAPNRRIVYSLSEGHRAFTINPTTGVITTAAKLRVGSDYNLTIVASDPNSQVASSTSILVRAMPSTKQRIPSFSNDSYTFNVTENADAGTLIGVLIGEEDISDVEYTLVGSDKAFFEVDKKGTIRTLSPLDYELQPQYHLVVNVSRYDGPFALVSVTVNVLDENDVEPRFPKKSYAATVMENSPINTFIINVQAVDEDSVLEYSLMMNSESSALSSLLQVDREGTVRNVEPLLGLEGKYQFAIIARDGRHTGASATVFLTILPTSKCQPTFPETVPDVFYVEENEFPGPTLAQFHGEVSSSDCQVTYAIWNGTKYVNETKLFLIDAFTGELKAKESFDCEEHDRHALVVAALSGDLFAQLDVEVRIVDQNDNPIEIIDDNVRFSIREDEQAAFDRDLNDSVFFHLKEDHGKFAIGRTDGVLKLAKKLDREEKDFYELHVMISNSEERPANEDDAVCATVQIMVSDVNDNGPIFESNLYTKAIPRDAIAGMQIVKVVAVDPDLVNVSAPIKKNCPSVALDSYLVHYRIDETIYRYMDRVRQANGFVGIDEKSGIVRLAQSPYDSAGGVFESRISSTDLSDNDSHVAVTLLKVWVYDVTHIVQVDIDENAKDLDVNGLENLIKLLSELCDCEVLLFQVKYISSDGRLLRQAVRAQFLFINRTNNALLPADRAISIIDKKALNPKSSVPKLSAAVSHVANTVKIADMVTPYSRLREAALLLAIFTFLLFSVLIVFSVILCYHRSKFLREKKMYEDEKIAVGSLNKNDRYKQPPPYVKPIYHNLREKYPNATNENTYAVQEIKMLVGVDDALKRVHYNGSND